MKFIFITLVLTLFFSSFAFANKITWLGQASLLIKTKQGKKILIDPFIYNNPKTPKEFKDDKKYKDIDLVLVTHGHGDHLGDFEKILKLSPKAKVSMNADMAKVLINIGKLDKEKYLPLNKSGVLNLFDNKLKVTMVRAEHSSALEINGDVHYGGEPVGYVLEFSNGRTLYHAGDTGVFGDMKMIGSYFELDVAMVPIGGSYTMGPKEAAYAVDKLIKPKLIIPIHYGTFPALKGTTEDFKKHLINKKILKVIEPGESFTMI